MIVPNYFKAWFNKYGMLDDGWSSLAPWQYHRIMLIAWRAYRKGRKDATKG